MALVMNANLPAFLWYIIIEHGAEDNFVKTLLIKSCKATLVAEMYECKWDAATRMLTVAEEVKRENNTKVVKSA